MENNYYQELREGNFFKRCHDALANYLDELETDSDYLRLEDELESNQAKVEEVRKLLSCLEAVMRDESGQADNVKIAYEEKYVDQDNETTTLYFGAPKEVLNGKFPEATLVTTLSVEFPTDHCDARYTSVQISPQAKGINYDWQDLELPYSVIENLMSLANDAEYLTRLNELRDHCEEMFDQTGGTPECDDWDERITALDRATNQLKAAYREKANGVFLDLCWFCKTK